MNSVQQIVDRALAGDQYALECLITQFQSMAIGYAYSLVGDFHTAEDIAQEAFIQAYKSLHNLRNSAAFPAWFKTIIRFMCIRFLRGKRVPIRSLEEADDMTVKQTVEEELIMKEESDFSGKQLEVCRSWTARFWCFTMWRNVPTVRLQNS